MIVHRSTNQFISTKEHSMKFLTKALVGALVLLVPILGMGCEEEPKPPPTPPVCELPFGDTACVAVDSVIYPVTADACTNLGGKKPYFCRQAPESIECEKTEREGMWCCCDSASIGCDVKTSPPKDPDPDVCIDPPAGSVCMLLESTGYAELATACMTLNTKLVPYFCSDEPKQEASCMRPDPLVETIWCCCDPRTDMFCEAHLAP
jgi:hypothetical protein